MSCSRDAVVSTHTSWVCTSPTELREILHTPPEELLSTDPPSALCGPVLLERAEDASPCVLTLLCVPDSGAVISSVQMVSEARTLEVYSLSGDYCGTSRGEEEECSGGEEQLFYRNRLVLENPLPSCEVKLLSLGGRSVVGIRQLVVGLRFRPGGEVQPGPGPSIDFHRVQTMMEEMGTTLCPGAQNLLEMVQFQQKNKAEVLTGLLPLLMGGGGGGGGAFPCLTRPAGRDDGTQARTGPQSGTFSAPDAEAGACGGTQSPVSPDLLPVLQSVCGQVTQLRLSSSEKRTNGQREDHVFLGGVEKVLEQVVEKRMQDLEVRLMERMDSRLDALQQRLELTLGQLTLHTTSSTHTQ